MPVIDENNLCLWLSGSFSINALITRWFQYHHNHDTHLLTQSSFSGPKPYTMIHYDTTIHHVLCIADKHSHSSKTNTKQTYIVGHMPSQMDVELISINPPHCNCHTKCAIDVCESVCCELDALHPVH
eukprot:502831_1